MIRLSQCMIVKNEEKNIETALRWAKDITFEQIVVDTGSTDNTVELAKQLGAKVYHFEWINDFAAAKNYAIEKATGDWIAFLDADEFFSPEDTAALSTLLTKIESDLKTRENILGIVMPWVNVDDSGKPMTIASQARIFRNKPTIRYIGRIHESLSIDAGGFINADNISIIHTGYSQSAHMETGKSERNAELLREELKSKPNDISLKAYLANALSIRSDEVYQAEAEILFSDVIKSKESIDVIHKIKAYMFLINKYKEQPGRLPDCEDMCRQALALYPGTSDFEYLLAVVLSKKGEHQKAWELLKGCEARLTQKNKNDYSIMINADPTILYGQMILTAKDLNELENVVLYSTQILIMDKTRKSVLGPCITMLLKLGITENEVLALLSSIYDMENQNDLKFIAQTSTEYGAKSFADSILQLAEGVS